MVKKDFMINTKCVHAGKYIDENSLGINTPIYPSTVYLFPNNQNIIRYPRNYNIPTQTAVAEKLAAMEYGECGLVFSSGMAAITTVLFTFLKSNDHAIFQSGLYGGTQRFIKSELPRYGIEIDIVESNNPEVYKKVINDNTKLIFIESPTNPLLDILDLRAISELTSDNDILTIVDNTFATPINQNPLKLGVDIVIHSGTKYLNGHSDVSCGAVITDEKLMKSIKSTAINHGGVLDVNSCFQLERGLKTLGLRVERQNKNAQLLAEFLSAQPLVKKVFYPGLPSHNGYDIAKTQMNGFGGMVSFELVGDSVLAKKFVKALNLITPAVSLGGVESILCFPAETSHNEIPEQERKQQGISDSLVRLSVGIEDYNDLANDLKNAFDVIV
jgi:cystathionine beta-lyase